MRGWMSAVVFALATAGCQHAKTAPLAWPSAPTTADDGGESIEPHSTSVATAVETSDDDEAVVAVVVPDAKPAAAPEADKPATVTPPTQPPDGDVIISEEIIIDIDD